jgi:hypothetical protein
MLLLRAAFMEWLMIVHVIGAAVLFRRFFPRESPWLGFLVPILALLSVLNFIEHYVALPNLGWLLPVTLGGSLWTIFKPGYSWDGLRFPGILFVVTFTFLFGLKCSGPDIPTGSEGMSNLIRILNYSLGGTLPPVDCALPPYDYGGYYTFQHYGAAIVKRLFSLDLGSAYNLSFAFLMTWICLMGAGVAHCISGKKWIAVTTMIILLASASGSLPILIFFGPRGPDYGLSTDLNLYWNQPELSPFAWICAHDKYHTSLVLMPPVYGLYWSEFHASLGGAFMTIAAVLASVEVFRPERSIWPWICLFVLPMACIITSALFTFVVAFYCLGSLLMALLAGWRPVDWKRVGIASAVGIFLLWPSVYSILCNPLKQDFLWSPAQDRTPLWIFAIQWWPVYLPWVFLCFAWYRLDLMGRWLHAAIPLLLIGVEVFTVDNRTLTTEKMWGAIYGAGQVTLLPYLFQQKGWNCRGLSLFLFLNGLLCLGALLKIYYWDSFNAQNVCHTQGDCGVQSDPQKRRLEQVLRRLHGATILPGKSYWSFNEAPSVVTFSENRCFIAYTYQEYHAGHGDESDYRSKLNNDFYDGKVAAPLSFLRSNHINAIMIWPGDTISNQLLQQFKTAFASDYFYVDCKLDGENNAGVFLPLNVPLIPPAPAAPPASPPPPVAVPPAPNPPPNPGH